LNSQTQPFFYEINRSDGDGINIISDDEDHCTSCSDAESDNEVSIDFYEKGDDDEKDSRASNEEEGWIDDDDETNVCEKSIISRFKISNCVQATHLLSDESINSMLIKNEQCIKGRKCTPCPNDGECGECFGPIKSAKEIIRAFRRKYWEKASESGQIFLRRKQLLQDIDTMKVMNTVNSQMSIQYKIDGIFVCNSFFFVSRMR